ncbi:MAG: helical backbone metal receptor [Synergistaceae bacterium]|nr:helical backbone metal receptor [Synergistaceae bacterium]
MEYSRKFLTAALFAAGIALAVPAGRAHGAADAPARVLSITPAATEILYSLGLGDRVAAVTRYCNWPPEAKSKPVIGDMMNVNLEMLAALDPDLVLISNLNEHLSARIKAMGYKTVVVYQDNFDQICKSILDVGEACGVSDAARAKVGELRGAVEALKGSVPSGTPPRVLIVVGRDPADDELKRLYVAGAQSFYDDLIRESGAVNALDSDVQYLQVSREGLLRLEPDVIIDLIGEHGTADVSTERIQGQWSSIPDLRAAAEKNVSIVRGDFSLRPGPRYPLLLDAFIRAIWGGEREITG